MPAPRKPDRRVTGGMAAGAAATDDANARRRGCARPRARKAVPARGKRSANIGAAATRIACSRGRLGEGPSCGTRSMPRARCFNVGVEVFHHPLDDREGAVPLARAGVARRVRRVERPALAREVRAPSRRRGRAGRPRPELTRRAAASSPRRASASRRRRRISRSRRRPPGSATTTRGASSRSSRTTTSGRKPATTSTGARTSPRGARSTRTRSRSCRARSTRRRPRRRSTRASPRRRRRARRRPRSARPPRRPAATRSGVGRSGPRRSSRGRRSPTRAASPRPWTSCR